MATKADPMRELALTGGGGGIELLTGAAKDGFEPSDWDSHWSALHDAMASAATGQVEPLVKFAGPPLGFPSKLDSTELRLRAWTSSPPTVAR